MLINKIILFNILVKSKIYLRLKRQIKIDWLI